MSKFWCKIIGHKFKEFMAVPVHTFDWDLDDNEPKGQTEHVSECVRCKELKSEFTGEHDSANCYKCKAAKTS